MNFPQLWARGRSGDFFAWRWSFQSLAEAQALADQAAQQLADRFRAGIHLPQHGGYYPDRPFREQVLQEIKSDRGETAAVITRNSYGCLVLNTARIMFVDIDLPEPKTSGGFFKKLFGKPEAEPATNPQSLVMARIENWTRTNSEWGWRIYRTRSGLRLLATQALVEANSDAANRVFEDLGADPLYRNLCNSQKCFRARLTPKPWRCGLRRKAERWPWLDAKQENRFRKWEAQYRDCCANWAACAFVRQIGNPAIDPGVHTILTLHDERTRAESGLQLA
jgi:hypothetical protein